MDVRMQEITNHVFILSYIGVLLYANVKNKAYEKYLVEQQKTSTVYSLQLEDDFLIDASE